eukprot:555863-Hanusia_phi.AAC.1
MRANREGKFGIIAVPHVTPYSPTNTTPPLTQDLRSTRGVGPRKACSSLDYKLVGPDPAPVMATEMPSDGPSATQDPEDSRLGFSVAAVPAVHGHCPRPRSRPGSSGE